MHDIDGAYETAAVPPSGFDAFVESMRANGYVGANVTIPHKAAAAGRCRRLTDRAERLASVNTLWFEGDALCGDTTDGFGFLSALDQEAPGWDAHLGLALVLGAGGAAAPIVDALTARGFGRVVIANRTAEKARALAKTLGCEAITLAEVPQVLKGTDLLVNATSAGMTGNGELAFDLAVLPTRTVVDDIVYVPAVTPLLRDARARSLRTVGGLGMLLHQATPGFTAWFGRTPEVDQACFDLLEADIGRA